MKTNLEVPVSKRVLYAIALISGEINSGLNGIQISQTTEGYDEVSACTVTINHPESDLTIKFVDKRRA